MRRIIDVHTHVPPRQDWDFFLQQCRENNVVIAATSSLGVGGWPEFPTEAQIHEANDEAYAFAEFAQGMVLWFAYINPQHDSWSAELDRCRAMGARGVKLWISIKEPETGSLDKAGNVLAAAAAYDLPVLLHTYQRTDDNRSGEISLAEFATLARAHPETTMIAAHAGGNWRQARGLATDLPNTFIDVCGGYPERGIVESLKPDIGVERILYGSDGLGRSIPSQIAKVIFADINNDEQEAILWDNNVHALKLAGADINRAEAAFSRVPADGRALPVPDLSVDHFCYCGSNCFREPECVSPAQLDAELAENGIKRAYVASSATFYCYDVLAENRRFAESARAYSRIMPLATLLPYAFNWEVMIHEAQAGFAGGIVFPYLQNWLLDDPRFTPFFEACAEAEIPLWINCCTADIRFRPRGTVCRDVTPTEIVSFLGQAPDNSYVFQGVTAAGVRAALRAFPDLQAKFEISRLTDNSSALIGIVEEFGADNLVFGSEFPFRDLRTVAYTAQALCRQHPQ